MVGEGQTVARGREQVARGAGEGGGKGCRAGRLQGKWVAG